MKYKNDNSQVRLERDDELSSEPIQLELGTAYLWLPEKHQPANQQPGGR